MTKRERRYLRFRKDTKAFAALLANHNTTKQHAQSLMPGNNGGFWFIDTDYSLREDPGPCPYEPDPNAKLEPFNFD